MTISGDSANMGLLAMSIILRLQVEIVGGPLCGAKMEFVGWAEEDDIPKLVFCTMNNHRYKVDKLDLYEMTAKFLYWP